MTDRFECPRCQYVFMSEATDQAFSECPQCGSLALPREVSAEGMSVPEDGVPQSARAEDDALSGLTLDGFDSDTEVGVPPPASAITGMDSGIFQGLLPDEPASELPPGALHSDPGALPLSTTEGSPETFTLADASRYPATEQNVSQAQAPPSEIEAGPDITANPPSAETQVVQNPFFGHDQDDVDLGGLDEDFDGPTRAFTADPSALFEQTPGDDLSDDFDPFKGIELPAGGESVDLEVGPAGQEADDVNFAEETAQSPATGHALSGQGIEKSGEGSSEASGFEDSGATALGLDATHGELHAVAPHLSALEPELQLPVSPAAHIAEAGPDIFGEDALGALERAFDDVATASNAPPVPEPAATKTAEQLVEEAIAAQLAGAEPQTQPPPRPPQAPGPPPMRLRKVGRIPHLALSEEAIAAAALPLAAAEVSGLNPVPADPFAEVADSPNVNFLDEPTDIVIRRPRVTEEESPTRVIAAEQVSTEAEPASQDKSVDVKERLLAGFSRARVAMVAAIFAVIGGVIGGAMAPRAADKPKTKTEQAQEIYAKGNMFYEEGRFDDALGDYRSALALDPSFAPAIKAKAAALAKQRRYREAARAYEEYLERAPDAFDAPQVRDVLKRYRGDDGAEDS